ncbi:tumor necrosis factor receptor superfamily member 11A-like isoform X1 [Gadus chalcogrammus]|uniref:tumor necrosis factor receptor superfamily member 11A-like isoform X1 n=1 Tax=Gadus chalcogrammus TaxID=1042646 RepID=UPI0024C425C9|nr:tumor necrosis factor receptor superfamily member 11A-like isoform X1 [Gadus chalcogrammus]
MVEPQTNLTNMFLTFILICSAFNTFNVAIAASFECLALNEYLAGTECCPECLPGQYVVKDCTERSITKCSRCPDGTFQAGYNEQKQCSNCTKCDAGLGLKVKKSCSSTSDAVCEVLDGFFCSDSNGGGCRTAQRHTVCRPGQYIGQRGTADKDTECLHCTDGTFSDGTSSCQPHTTCDSGVQIQQGTGSTDSTCITYVPSMYILIIIIVGSLAIIVLIALICRRHLKEPLEQGKEFYGMLHQHLLKRETKEQKRKEHEEMKKLVGGAAGEGTSGLPSTPLLSTELPAGLETSIPPAPSSETQPAEVTTPLRSTDGPEPTGDQQVTPLSLSARRCRVRSKSVSSHFNIPRPRRRASLLKGNDVAEEEELPVLENLD